ncbi:meiotic recombination protein REC114-like [Amphibalanus amphitrite]|uniref:meiotic recombination protein REC114-like n=1 Tax=Amphibalanus amphitrite TaxID=1232801 RepID=UPI001C919F51|nr:meiotic recombination protein REC114-like [Amphibalanus amphitrite]
MREYRLATYARLTSAEAWDDCGTAAGQQPLKLSLLEVGFLVISAGSRELEALSISSDQQAFRAVYRDKHVLFLQRIGDQFRRFRVKFVHRREAADCVYQISKKIRVRDGGRLDVARKESAGGGDEGGEVVVLRGDVALGELAAAVLEPQTSQLPAAYSATAASMSTEEMEEAIRLHIMDASFPGFVETVEQLIRQMAAS